MHSPAAEPTESPGHTHTAKQTPLGRRGIFTPMIVHTAARAAGGRLEPPGSRVCARCGCAVVGLGRTPARPEERRYIVACSRCWLLSCAL